MRKFIYNPMGVHRVFLAKYCLCLFLVAGCATVYANDPINNNRIDAPFAFTVTGKVVREITRAELGPLRIGRNLTEYKWDGRDQFGQLLGNGVYLYRVITSLNGQDVDLRADSREMTRNGGGIDKYFKNSYGKMYIMR